MQRKGTAVLLRVVLFLCSAVKGKICVRGKLVYFINILMETGFRIPKLYLNRRAIL